MCVNNNFGNLLYYDVIKIRYNNELKKAINANPNKYILMLINIC